MDAKGLCGLRIIELEHNVHLNYVERLKMNPAQAASASAPTTTTTEPSPATLMYLSLPQAPMEPENRILFI
jgi:hypothetical protein